MKLDAYEAAKKPA